MGRFGKEFAWPRATWRMTGVCAKRTFNDPLFARSGSKPVQLIVFRPWVIGAKAIACVWQNIMLCISSGRIPLATDYLAAEGRESRREWSARQAWTQPERRVGETAPKILFQTPVTP